MKQDIGETELKADMEQLAFDVARMTIILQQKYANMAVIFAVSSPSMLETRIDPQDGVRRVYGFKVTVEYLQE